MIKMYPGNVRLHSISVVSVADSNCHSIKLFRILLREAPGVFLFEPTKAELPSSANRLAQCISADGGTILLSVLLLALLTCSSVYSVELEAKYFKLVAGACQDSRKENKVLV
jgi:hypothetical protein